MTHTNISQSWFVAPPLRGAWPAVFWILLSLPVATAIRSVMNCGEVIGECCTPLFLYVMVSAVLLGPLVALVTTGASAAVSLILFSEQANRVKMGPDGEFWGLALFLIYCFLIVGAVESVRRSFVRFSRLAGGRERSSGVVFSLEGGQAWANWPGAPSPVRLGPENEVTEMMQDFVAQVKLGRRLDRRIGNVAESRAPPQVFP